MKNRKTLVATGCALVAILLISTMAFTLMQGRSQPGMSPGNLDQLINYPGMVLMTRDWDPGEIQTEILQLDLGGTIRGIPVEGANEVRQKMTDKGYLTGSFFDITWDLASDIQVVSPDGLETAFLALLKGWSNTMLPDGTKALIAIGVNMFDGTSIIQAATTNVLPPDQMPGRDPYIIWNAEPYFYVQYWWWVWGYGRLVYWKYWWYDSHKAPNWFWGPYWWWYTYLKAYSIVWRWWYWYWWHWYYWRGWYWWSTYWPYI